MKPAAVWHHHPRRTLCRNPLLLSSSMADLGHRLRGSRNVSSQIEKHIHACEKSKKACVLKQRPHETDSDSHDKTDEVFTRLNTNASVGRPLTSPYSGRVPCYEADSMHS